MTEIIPLTKPDPELLFNSCRFGTGIQSKEQPGLNREIEEFTGSPERHTWEVHALPGHEWQGVIAQYWDLTPCVVSMMGCKGPNSLHPLPPLYIREIVSVMKELLIDPRVKRSLSSVFLC